jgi:hypothetical protein
MFEIIKEYKNFKYLISLVALSAAFFVLSFYYFTWFQMFAAGILMAAIGIAIYDFIDTKVNNGIDSYIELVEKRNIAYAINMLGYAVIIAAGFIASALAFFALK